MKNRTRRGADRPRERTWRPRRDPARAAPRAARRLVPRPAPLVVLAAGAVALAAWLALRPHARTGTTGATLPAMPPREAYERAAQLGLAGRFTESLPYFRAAAGEREDFARLHFTFAAALYNGCFQVLGRHPPIPATRSSFERVRMMREALHELERASRFELGAGERAALVRQHGEWLQAWGFNWEAFIQYRHAQQLDPGAGDEALHARAFMTLMRYPDRYSPEAVPLVPGEQ